MARFFLLLAVVFSLVAAQGDTVLFEGDSALHRKYKVDFAVPDLPAFQVLGANPAELLRPSTPELLSIVTSSLLEGRVIPKSLALEIAPLMMAEANNLTLVDYDRNRVLYSLRLSVGTTSEETDSGAVRKQAGVGVRMTLLDRGDLRSDRQYRADFHSRLLDRNRLSRALDAEWYKAKGIIKADTIHTPAGDTILAEARAYVDSMIGEREKELGGTLDEWLGDLKQEYKEKNWNAAKWDVAAGGLFSQDSAEANILASRASVWTTGALPVGGWGQALFGVTANWFPAADEGEEWTALLGTRMYGGANALKGMVEAQYEIAGAGQHDLLVNGGAEAMVWSGIWVNVSAGVEWLDLWQGTEAHLVSDLGVRFTPPENTQLF